MKIGFYSPYLDTFGGGERYMLTLASHLSDKYLVDIFWDDASIKPPLARFLKIDLAKTNFTKNIFQGATLQKMFKTRSYDLIFFLSDGSVPLTFASQNILHFQVPFKFAKISLSTKLKLLRFNHVVVNSQFTKKYIDESFNVDSKVIYPPVDILQLAPAEKENIILSVGRFNPHQLHPKKQEILIGVFKELQKVTKDWKLYLVGQAKKEDQKYLRKLKKIARGHAIKIIENLSSDELIKLYSKASIYWHATGFGEDENRSPERMEHFGIATVEASAAGVVPVVIEKGGQREIIKNGKNGLLWSTKTQLYEQTLALVKNKQKMSEFSQNAIKNSKRFSKEKFLREYEKIIFA